MAVKITYREMIVLVILFAIFIAIANLMLGPEGPWITMGIMIGIFVIFKAYKFFKKTEEEKESGELEE